MAEKYEPGYIPKTKSEELEYEKYLLHERRKKEEQIRKAEAEMLKKHPIQGLVHQARKKQNNALKEAVGKTDKASPKRTDKKGYTGRSVKREQKSETLSADVVHELKKMEVKRRIFLSVAGFVALCCFVYYGSYYYMAYRNQAKTDKFRELKEYSAQNVQENKNIVVHKTGPMEAPDILPEYSLLCEENPNLIGWVKIDDTFIDYPVMQCEDNDFYLNHDFGGEPDNNGCIFMDAECRIIDRSTNLIVYGHNMKSGNMFGQLDKYKNEDFYKEHPTFVFDTIYENGTYQVAYVFKTTVLASDEVAFKYYQFINANSKEEFDSNMRQMAAMSLYDTNCTPAYGDELVTLSTCEHSVSDGRFVVVGKKL